MNEFDPPDDMGKTLPPVTVPSKGDSPFDLPRQPPIGIIHVLIWTACTALLMAGHRWFNTSGEMSDEHALFRTVTSVLNSILYGMALGGPILLVYRRLTGGAPFPVQPGHWLLLVEGFGCLIIWSAFVGTRVLERWNDTPDYDMFYVAVRVLTIQASLAVVLACVGWRFRGELYWRLYFWIRLPFYMAVALAWLPPLVSHYTQVPFSLVNGVQSCGVFVWGLWLVAAVIADWAKAKRRDWLHWLGVVVSFGGTVMYLISRLWFWLASILP